jgi:putative aminopeptidase FrvX
MLHQLLHQLTQIPAVSTDEGRVQTYLQKKLQKQNLHVQVDAVGNVMVGSSTPKVLVTAHMDEVGIIITKIEVDGMCRVSSVGFVEPKMAAGEKYVFQTPIGELTGVVLYEHAFEIDAVKSWDDLKLDLGFESKKAAEKVGVVPGLFGTYPKSWSETSDKIVASSLDNRVGVSLLCQLAEKYVKQIKSGSLSLIFSSTEESDYAGIKWVAANVRAQYTVVVDIMPNSFLSGHHDIALDGGPMVVYKMGNHLLMSGLKEKLHNVPHQKYFHQPAHHFMLESEVIQGFGSSLSLNFLVPITNYHHSDSTISKKSLAQAEKSLYRLVKNLVE